MIAVKDGFVRVAAATPRVSVANVEENARRVGGMVHQAAEAGCGAVCFPELALTGYTCGDLFRDRALLSGAERALASLLEETAGLDILCAVGVPVPWNGALYNCAAVFHKGRLLGLPPAHSQLPEFYEARHSPRPGAGGGLLRRAKGALGRGPLFCCERP
ncbi:MAG: nitrilase-related carbon-nitrogen hydrolase [Acutalibacter sp.]